MFYKITNRINAHVDGVFLMLIGLMFLINAPYFLHEFNFIPVHDTMAYAQIFSFIFNEYIVNGEIPLWMPYNLYGSPIDYNLLYTMSPALYFMLIIGKFLGIRNAIFVFKIAILIEQLILLYGSYLLAKRLYTSRTSIIAVTFTVVAISFWAVQLYWNFRLYYLMPFMIFFLIKFYDTTNWTYVITSGIVFFLSLFGNVTYCAPVYFAIYVTFAAYLLFPKMKQIISNAKTLLSPLPIALTIILVAIAYTFWDYSNNAFNSTAFYTFGRDHVTRKVPFMVFLEYGPLGHINAFLELFYAAPSYHAATFYIGLVPLAFLVYAIFVSYGNHIFKSLLILSLVVLLIGLPFLTYLPTIFYFLFPMFDYFRHLGLLHPLAKICFLFMAGFGIDALIKTSDKNQNPNDNRSKNIKLLFIIGMTLICLLLILDIITFKGALPYTPAFRNINAVHFHFFALLILIAFTFFLYHFLRTQKGNVTILLLACIFLEITSYHHFLFHFFPVRYPEPKENNFETVEEYQSNVQLLKNSFVTKKYSFQHYRQFPDELHRTIEKTSPLTTKYYGAKYSTNYSAAYVDPCLQDYRVDYLPQSIDRFIRARMGVPIDVPLSGRAPLPNDLKNDQVFLRAMGCGTEKMRILNEVHLAENMKEAADIIHTSSHIDTIPVLLNLGKNFLSNANQNVKKNDDISITRFTANSVSVETNVSSPNGAWLLYRDAYHSGWVATVNGKEKPVFPANLAFKAIQLNTGKNKIRFSFKGNGLNGVYTQIFFIIGIFSVSAFLLYVLLSLFPFIMRTIENKSNLKK